MKKIFLPALLITLFGLQIAHAQSATSLKKSNEIQAVLASQPSSNDHNAVLDQIQQESEELLLAIAPPLSFAKLIEEKLARKESDGTQKCGYHEKKKKKKERTEVNHI